MAGPAAQAIGRCQCRRRDGRRRRARRRAVDDQHRYRRYRRDGQAGHAAGARRLGNRAHHRRPRRGGGGGAASSATGCAAWAIDVPLVGDFHYIGHKLLTDHPACAEALAKYRINPGNVGFKAKRDTQFSTLIEIANRYDKPVRIGVNWGSLDEELLTRLMDENAASATPISAAAVQREAIIQSALLSAQRAEELGHGARQDHPLDQGLGRPAPDRGLPGPRGALRLCAASGADRGGHGHQGHRRLVGGDGHPAAAGDRRHDPHFADARAGRRPHARGARWRRNCCRPWASASSCRWSRPAPAAGARRRRHVPGAGQGNPGSPLEPRCRSGRNAIRASRRCRWR